MAVYTPLSLEEAQMHLAAHYAIGDATSLQGIAEGVENSNFLLTATQTRYILTLYEKRVNVQELPFFIGVMEWLAKRGIPCPEPVRGITGEAIYILKERASCIVSFLPGRSVRNVRNEHLYLLGQMLARMHIAAENCPVRRENALSLQGWRGLVERIGTRADAITPALAAGIQAELEFLSAHWPQTLPQGVIHADLFPDNVFFVEGEGGTELSGVIDFYFACNDLFMYDLAICMNAWCFEVTHEFNITRAGQLLRGYHAVRPIAQAELDALPVLARGAALRFLLTRAYDWLNPAAGALVKPKDPMEYIKKLKFHQRVRHYGEYGF